MTVNVTSVNSPPSGANKTISMFEDVPYQFTQADFGFSDPNDIPSNGLAAIRLTTLPASARSPTTAWPSRRAS